jgi:NADH:ubiquinone reductase (H+-translocating)
MVIIGGGFGGLAAAKGLKRSAVNVLLIDRSNHHVFLQGSGRLTTAEARV